MTDWVYDIEVLMNVFTCNAVNHTTGESLDFEVSPRKNEFPVFLQWIQHMRINNDRMVGFNNMGYD